MKSFITKLSVLLFCGVMALTSCTDFSADLQYIDQKVDELAAKTEQQIRDLAASIAETYATKAELEAAIGQINDLKAAVEDLQELIDSKADKSALDAAIADLEAKIAAIKGCECEPSEPCTCEPVDLDPVYKAIEDAIAALEEQIAAIKGCECEPSEPCHCEPVDLTVINETIAALEEQIKATEAVLDEIKAELAKIDPILAEVNAKILEAMELAESAATPEEVAAAFAELEAKINAELDKIKADISDLGQKYEALNQRIAALEAALEALSDRIDALATELRGIVMVPQILVDGTPAVEFKSFAYVPMDANSDEVPTGVASVVLGSMETAAYYHFNPSNFDITSASYAVVSTTVETRATAEPVATVGEVTKEGDKVKVQLLRGKGTDNMFALAVTLQSGAVITSDYAHVLDAQTTADELVIVDMNDQPLYTTLAEAEANAEQINVNSTDVYNLADFVKPIDPYFASFGIEYKYALVYGDITVAEDGTTDLTNGNGVAIVKVEAVNGTDVVRRAYIRMNINYIEPEIPGIYYYASTTATVEAERIAFEVADIFAWLKALKDEPNTIEILKEVAGIAKNIADIQASDKTQIEKNFLIKEEALRAYQLLNGVPGFVKKYRSFSAFGEATERVQLIPEITSVAELVSVIELIEEQYPQIVIGDDLAIAIENFIPESLKNNPLVSSILDALKNTTLSDILGDERVQNLLEAGMSLADRLGLSLLDFDKLNDVLEEVIKKAVGENNYGEEAAKLMAQAKARAAAETALKETVDAANVELMANFENGTWGRIFDLLSTDLNLDNPIVAGILERLNLTETVNALVDVLGAIVEQGENLVQYTYEDNQIVFNDDEPVRKEIL